MKAAATDCSKVAAPRLALELSAGGCLPHFSDRFRRLSGGVHSHAFEFGFDIRAGRAPH
jgi:hypothetical protein